jgi:hypothetical protein
VEIPNEEDKKDSMKRLLALSLLAVAGAFAQAPNCNQLSQIVTTTGAGLTINNGTDIKCSVWRLMYFSQGFSALSIQIEVAQDNNGQPAAFSVTPVNTASGLVVAGTNPATSNTSSTITINGYFPWIRVNVTSVTGTGSIEWNLIGNSYISPVNVAFSGGPGGTTQTIGPTPVGSAATQPPVEDSGVDGGGLVRYFLTDVNGVLQIGGFNGTLPDRLKVTSIVNNQVATTTAQFETGVLQTDKGARWAGVSNPAAGSQATFSIAANAAQRHIADCVGFSAGSTTAPALTALTVNLRDGATGAGTIIHTWQIIIPALTGQNVLPFEFCGLALAGTTNTAMTLEFSASLANLIESVSLSGYNVQ